MCIYHTHDITTELLASDWLEWVSVTNQKGLFAIDLDIILVLLYHNKIIALVFSITSDSYFLSFFAHKIDFDLISLLA